MEDNPGNDPSTTPEAAANDLAQHLESSATAADDMAMAHATLAESFTDMKEKVLNLADAQGIETPDSADGDEDESELEEEKTNEELAREAPRELKNRVEKIAETLFGSKDGSAEMAKDIVAAALRDGTETVLDLFDTLAKDVEVIKGEQREYQLTTLFLMRPKQLRRAHDLLKEIMSEAKERRHGRLGLSLENILMLTDREDSDDPVESERRRRQALNVIPADIMSWIDTAIHSEKFDLLMACLYVPAGKKWKPNDEELAAFAEELGDELTVGHRIGAVYRFFTYYGFSIQRAIRRCLALLTPLLDSETPKSGKS